MIFTILKDAINLLSRAHKPLRLPVMFGFIKETLKPLETENIFASPVGAQVDTIIHKDSKSSLLREPILQWTMLVVNSH